MYYQKSDGVIYKGCDHCNNPMHELTAKERLQYEQELDGGLDEEPENEYCSDECEDNAAFLGE